MSDAGTSWWYEDPPGYPYFTEWIITWEEIQAMAPSDEDLNVFVQGAASKIYSRGFDALTSLAELKELKGQFKSVANLLNRSNYRKVFELVSSGKAPFSWRTVNSKWLEARYGWRPLFYEIQQLIDVVANFDESRTRYSERTVSTYSYTTIDEQPYSWSTWNGLNTITTDVTISMRGSVTADIDVPKFQFNPIQTGWEIIPFSFVIDWFVGVGNALSAMSFLAAQSNYAASRGFKISAKRWFSSEVTEMKQGNTGDGLEQEAYCEATYDRRLPCSIPFVPQISVRLNVAKIVDLVALIAQRVI
jgi:hypothetical protein